MENEILEVLNNNSIQVNGHPDVIYGCDFENLASQLNDLFALRGVSRSLPTDVDYLSEVRVKLFDEHVERLSKQTKEWNLMEGIRLGLNAEKL